MPPAEQYTVSRAPVPAVSLPRIAVRHRAALLVLVLTALTFLAPAAPTYDPWAWLIWGREIAHFDLSTVSGPSWKPLPVLFTTPFSLFGSLAPDLWLFVARAGAIAGVVIVYRLGRRLGGPAAGIAAAVPYALAPWTLRNNAMGNSEGLQVALALAAVDQHLSGRPRRAFVCALGVALLRPEAWPFLGLYGLWLLWRVPRTRALVLAGVASVPLLWFPPEWLGSGDLLRAAHRDLAHTRAGSPALAENPALAMVDRFASMFTPAIWVGLAALVLVVAWRRVPGRREGLILGALVAGAVLWVLEVAIMSEGGYSGSIRYVVVPAAILCLAAGVGAAWLGRALLGRRVATGVGMVALAAVLALAFAAPAVHRIPNDMRIVFEQARVADELPAVVARAGGSARLRACGGIYTGPYEVPVVAWNMGMHTKNVSSLAPRRPAVLLRVTARPLSRAPLFAPTLGDPSDLTTLAIGRRWHVAAVCGGGGA